MLNQTVPLRGIHFEGVEVMNSAEYTVTGMTCSHCERAVTDEVAQIPGVENIDVHASTGRLVLTSTIPLEDSAVFAAVDEAGYAASRA